MNKVRIVNRIIASMSILALLICIYGCAFPEPDPDYVPPEQPHLYWKDIDVVVTDISRRRWFAGTHWHEVTITVESQEYGLTRTLTYKGSGFFGCPSQWGYEVGDVVRAQLYSWVMDSTGEVTKRLIHQVY